MAKQSGKRKYSAITLEEAMQLVPAEEFVRWRLDAPPRLPSEYLDENMRRLASFDLQTTEQAKTLLMDSLFGEIVPHYPALKIWKAAALEADTLTGAADYLITPKLAYVSTPFLCVAEVRQGDCPHGQAQCLVQMTVCRDSNQAEGCDVDVYGIRSNGQGWQFYKLTPDAKVFESEVYITRHMPELLGVLDYICAECARNVPAQNGT